LTRRRPSRTPRSVDDLHAERNSDLCLMRGSAC
jgi:hypothetical protein